MEQSSIEISNYNRTCWLRSLIFDKNKLRSVQKSSNSSDVWLGDLYKHVKKLTQIISLYNRKVVLVINTNTSSLCVARMVSAQDIISWNGYSTIVIFNRGVSKCLSETSYIIIVCYCKSLQ